MDKAFENFLRAIRQRSWKLLKPAWATLFQSEQDLLQFSELEFCNILAFAMDSAHRGPLEIDQREFKIELLKRSLFDGMRGFNLAGTAGRTLADGFPTSSCLQAYQAAYFMASSLAALAGIGYCEIKSRVFGFDAWPSKFSMQNKDYRGTSIVYPLARRLDHRAHWAVFIEAIRVITGQRQCKPYLDALKSTSDAKDFSRRRNGVIYRRNWLFPDLLTPCATVDFGVLDRIAKVKDELREADFQYLSQLLIAQYVIIRDLANFSPLSRECLMPYLEGVRQLAPASFGRNLEVA